MPKVVPSVQTNSPILLVHSDMRAVACGLYHIQSYLLAAGMSAKVLVRPTIDELLEELDKKPQWVGFRPETA